MTSGPVRILAAAAIVAATLGGGSPAAADPAQPTNFTSTIADVDPPFPTEITARIVGGDAFLELTVGGAHEVIVPDYESTDEEATVPYLRFSSDGTVEENLRSSASAVNQDRYGAAPARAVDPDEGPLWTTVATDGRYAWHDHRVHWMAPTQPPTGADGLVDLGGPGGAWEVDLIVDGTPTVVSGTLRLQEAPSPWPWALAGFAVAGAAATLALRRGIRMLLVASIGTSALAVAASWATYSASPPEAGASIIPVAVAITAAVAALIAAFGPVQSRLVATAGVAAGLGGWAVTRMDVVTHAVLPTSWPFGLDRAVTIVALAVAIVVAVELVRSPAALRTDHS